MWDPQRDNGHTVGIIFLVLKHLCDSAASFIRKDCVLDPVDVKICSHSYSLSKWCPNAAAVVNLRFFGSRVIKQGSTTDALKAEAFC